MVIDKPVALSEAEFQQLSDASQQAGQPVIPFQNRRWDGDFLTIRQLIHQDWLGPIVRFESHFDRFRPTPKGAWRDAGDPADGGGLLYDLGSHLIDQVIQLFGLLPVAGGSADNACAAIGAGIVAPGQALVSIGTSGVVLAFSATPQVDRSGPIPRVHTFNHALPRAWYLMGVTQAAGLSLRWARDQLGGSGNPSAPLTYDAINAEAASVPTGSDGLLFLPYLQGERTPWLDAQARGGWLGLTARHTRAHLFRSVMEGVSFSLYDCLSVLRASGIGITELRATGGGVRGALWRQILADVFGLPLLPLATEEGPALGAALLAGIATNVYSSAHEACNALVRLAPATSPITAQVARYQALYPIYHALYPALKETMHALVNFGA